jgi:hypothetical protein
LICFTYQARVDALAGTLNAIASHLEAVAAC